MYARMFNVHASAVRSSFVVDFGLRSFPLPSLPFFSSHSCSFLRCYNEFYCLIALLVIFKLTIFKGTHFVYEEWTYSTTDTPPHVTHTVDQSTILMESFLHIFLLPNALPLFAFKLFPFASHPHAYDNIGDTHPRLFTQTKVNWRVIELLPQGSNRKWESKSKKQQQQRQHKQRTKKCKCKKTIFFSVSPRQREGEWVCIPEALKRMSVPRNNGWW